jgi:uncharacterized protein (DUF2147 family)
MKKFLIAVFFLIAGPAFADPAEGTWKTIPDDNGIYGHIEISMCGTKICGILTSSYETDGTPYASDNVGKQLMWDMVNQGGGNYGKGKVWSPDRDKTYSGKLVLTGDTMTVKGCVFGICRDGGVWTRVP